MDNYWNIICMYILRYIKQIIRVSHAEDDPSLSFCLTYIISLLTHSSNICNYEIIIYRFRNYKLKFINYIYIYDYMLFKFCIYLNGYIYLD